MNSNGLVFGNQVYGGMSSICKAAIHSGIIDESGGSFNIQVLDGLLPAKVIDGVEANSIEA